MLMTSRRDAALTARFLTPATPLLEDLFLGLRAETDQALGKGAPALYGKPYPYGYCLEITRDVQARLRIRLERPTHPGERALKAYLKSGGDARRVWGSLRGQFFQNALQVGGLYIDVSNDTVDVKKPKVEILPVAQSGFATIRDAAHFASIAEPYWNETIYANVALPSLAPLFPMIGVNAKGEVRIHSQGNYMVDLFRGSRFTLSERWLEEAPVPPAHAVDTIRHLAPSALLAVNPEASREAALLACAAARAQRRASDDAWRSDRVRELLATRNRSIPVLERG